MISTWPLMIPISGNCCSHQPSDTRRLGRVAAQDSMRTQQPDITELRDRDLAQLRDCFRLFVVGGGGQQAINLASIKPRLAEVERQRAQLSHLGRQQGQVPIGFLVDPVVGQAKAPNLLRAEILGDMDGNSLSRSTSAFKRATSAHAGFPYGRIS